MKKLLAIVVLCLLWSNISIAESKWYKIENDNAVRVSIKGENTLSGEFTYGLIKKNNKCDFMRIFVAFISNGERDVKKILGMTIPIKIDNSDPINALIVRVTPAFDDELKKAINFLDLSQEQIDLIKKTQKIILAIGDEKIIDKYDFKSVEKKITMELVKVVEFDPSEYFLNLTNTWNLSGNRTAVEEGRGMCKK